ncbi:MAG: right-handed parallel beta-helix repeat-containing protein [Planctomycetes bacterium]|nr:right-handed parallel beta-helix repeat-containing protein [Planctomycetota bacterium]
MKPCRILSHQDRTILFAAFLSVSLASTAAGQNNQDRPAPETGEPAWVEPLRRVHARFHGTPGTLAQFGDSITVTMAYWTPLSHQPKNLSPAAREALDLVRGHLRPECWREWKGAEFGSEGGMTSAWALENVERWLEKLKPEAALILFGTNDLHQMDADRYERQLREVAKKCLDRGTVAILSTVPPRSGHLEKARAFAAAVRRIGRDLQVPVIDYFEEVMKRRPVDWDGSMEKFKNQPGDEYQVPTLIARDGVHPSNPSSHANDCSEEGLRTNGYALRNYLSLLAYAEVLKRVIKAPPPLRAGEGLSPSPPGLPWLPRAPALPPPRGEVIRAAGVEELFQAAERVPRGGTILLADGRYEMPRYFALHTDGVTLRGESGDRTKVILDGKTSQHGELFGFHGCSEVTVADLTIQNARFNGFKINSDLGARRITIHNCVVHNIWQRGVKGPKTPEGGSQGCRVQHCLFYNDRPKQFSDDETDTPQTFGGNYIGGIDVMHARGWEIRDNIFRGIQGRTREGRGAVFLWVDSRDSIVERNVFIDCDQAVCLGNAHKDAATAVHATGILVRNNFIAGAVEGGIVAIYTRDCRLLHNTIFEPRGRRPIRIALANDGLLAANNLIAGSTIALETASLLRLIGNAVVDPAAPFADPAAGDLHLKAPLPGVTDAAERIEGVDEDFDRDRRDEHPDAGADELRK